MKLRYEMLLSEGLISFSFQIQKLLNQSYTSKKNQN